MITITISPVDRAGHFRAMLGERLLVAATRQPLLDGARALLDLGVDPSVIVVMKHAGSDVVSLRAKIGIYGQGTRPRAGDLRSLAALCPFLSGRGARREKAAGGSPVPERH